ncbi:Exopolyphosphatase [Litoreibacter arenae DSM 19593]|uniref:Exopolyphosphatase n=1 Tax=Litoreibacter arenae DSM 19593 TaxID=1123360 RepID=S9QJT8_9RHOB|nr:Ppx/GppA family phosphatase [Litoreibacter arenae]EPX79863.1 Exopolyphosphatase [Litoreibacter arenae DSM 19593]
MDGYHDEDGPFGRPLFNDPKAKALKRVGAIDVGSNSVRMVVFDGAARSPAYFFNEKVMAGLGAGLSETGHLNPEGRDRALAALCRFSLLAKGMGVSPMTCVATAAVRDAADGEDFRADVARETGLNLWVAEGSEEARLSAQGVFLGWPTARGLMCDIGGSSMELAELGDGVVGRRVSSQIGPLKLMSMKGGAKARKALIDETIDDLREQIDGDYDTLFLVGGSWRAIARLDMERRGYPLKVLHEYRMTAKSILQTVKWISEFSVDELRAMTGNSEARMRLVPIASQVLKSLILRFKPKSVAVSSYGIREGLLYEQMPFELKRRDPLIEACRYDEAMNARIPGFGKFLYRFIEPLFSKASPERIRLVKAACLLHDVSWRAHPDYRAEVCFDNATRANFGGLDHQGRIFLGVALLHRYKNSRAGTRFQELFELLPEKDLRDAEVLGKAMRFGAMFSVQRPELMGQLKWHPKKRLLKLKLHPDTKALFGEVAQARFASLASSLNAETLVS